MMRQCLAPGMENRNDADLGAQPMRIGGERRHGLGGGFEQDRVDRGLVLIAMAPISAGRVNTTWK